MESGLVENHNNEIVKKFFKEELQSYTVISETSYGPYWGVQLKDTEIEIRISGDIGFSIEVIISGSKFDLWQYDRKVNNAMNTSDRNILYQLEVLKRFLSESPS
ncbi:MAG: hypothetical protein ACK5ZY_12835 [Cyclobacteriaceae bacterium]